MTAAEHKLLKKVQSAAAAALEKAGEPVKQSKLAGKVLKKVQHKYGDVTEQQVTSLLQQVLQQDNNSLFRVEGSKVALNPAAAAAGVAGAQQKAAPAAAAGGGGGAGVQANVAQQQHQEQQQQQQKKKKRKRKEEDEQQQNDGGDDDGGGEEDAAGHHHQQQQQQRGGQRQQQPAGAARSPVAGAIAAHVAAANGARITYLGGRGGLPAPPAAAAAGGGGGDAEGGSNQPAPAPAAPAPAAAGEAAAKGVAAKFARHLAANTTQAAAGGDGDGGDGADAAAGGTAASKPRKRKAADGNAAGGDDDAPKQPKKRGRKPKKLAAAAVAAAAAAGGGGNNDLLAALAGDGETWREDYNRTDLKHGPFEPHETQEVQDYVTAFAKARGLPDQPGTCDWLMDLKAHNITRNQLTEAIYRPCLPHRACKAVWQYINRVFPPYKWGPWTEEEDNQLRQLQASKGNRWKEIGLVLGRHAEAVGDRWKNLHEGREVKKGRWTSEEEVKLKGLVEAIKEQRQALSLPRTISEALLASAAAEPRLMGTLPRDDVDWNWVAEQMGTRSVKQCVDKWYTCLAPSMLSTGDWALQQDKQLVAALQGALQAGPEWEIDWDTLVPGRSMEQAKRRWRVLMGYLPLAERKTFKDAVAAAAAKYKLKPGNSAGAGGGAAAAAAAGGGGGGGRRRGGAAAAAAGGEGGD